LGNSASNCVHTTAKCDQAADAQGDSEPRQSADRYQKPRGQEEYCKDGSKRKDGKPLKAGAVAQRYVIDRVERIEPEQRANGGDHRRELAKTEMIGWRHRIVRAISGISLIPVRTRPAHWSR
jgi:hypothetical protein